MQGTTKGKNWLASYRLRSTATEPNNRDISQSSIVKFAHSRNPYESWGTSTTITVAYGVPGTSSYAVLEPVTARRLGKLETFEGDSDLEYEKPALEAVAAVGLILKAIFAYEPSLKSPAISPASDGEILISWRDRSNYLVLHFDKGTTFEWVFKGTRALSGVANATDANTQRDLASIIAYLFTPSVLMEVVRRPLSGTASFTFEERGASSLHLETI